MRKIANVKDNTEVRRIMLYECAEGVYFFEFDKDHDAAAVACYRQDSPEIFYEIAEQDYNVMPGDWEEIPDPMPLCQHDRIEPVRLVGRDTGTPQRGEFERLVDGRWVPLDE